MEKMSYRLIQKGSKISIHRVMVNGRNVISIDPKPMVLSFDVDSGNTAYLDVVSELLDMIKCHKFGILSHKNLRSATD